MNPFLFNLMHASHINLWKLTARQQFLHSKTLLIEASAITRSYTCIFQPVSAMIVESAYYAHALLSNSFFIVFLVQGIEEEIYTKHNKDISITEEVP